MKKTSLIFSIISMGFLLQACGDTQTNEGEEGTEAVVPNTEVVATDEANSDFALGEFDARDYKAVVKMEGMTGLEGMVMGDITIEYDGAIKASRVVSTQNGVSMEAIETPTAVYVKMGETWTRMPVDPADMEADSGMMTKAAIKEWMGTPGVKDLGKEDCGKTKCQVFEKEEEGMIMKMYIEAKNGLPQKIVSTLEEGGTTMITYDFDQNVEIEIPEVAEGSIPGLSAGMMDMEGIDKEAMEELMKELEGMEQ